MLFTLDLFPGLLNLPRTVPVEGGTFIGQLNAQNVPHGLGFLFFDDTRNHLAIIYYGSFDSGVEHGDGFLFHPYDGSFSYATYHHGKRVESPARSHSELNNMLLKHLSTMCFFLYHSHDDLNIEKETVEQVNSALVSAREKNEKLIQLLHSTPGVDINRIEAIMNPPHPRNTVRALNMDFLREDEDVLADVLGENEDMLDDTDDNNSTDDNESDEDYSDNDDDDEDYLFNSSDDDDNE